jgi:hypothetical protein
MINDVITATATIYAVDPVTKQLTPKQKVVSQVPTAVCDVAIYSWGFAAIGRRGRQFVSHTRI